MLDAGQLHILERAGVTFRSAESPVLWTHLENCFADSKQIGSKFTPMAAAEIAAVIADGESALLDAMARMVRDTGRIGHVRHVMTLDHPVGTVAMRAAAGIDAARVITLIQSPGQTDECLIKVLMASAAEMPCTRSITIEGGLYADGRTAGYFSLHAGDTAAGGGQDAVLLATEAEIRSLAAEMMARSDDVTSVSPAACVAMAERALQG